MLALKGDGESFTDVIEKLLPRVQGTVEKIAPFFGIWKDDPIITIEELESDRSKINKELDIPSRLGI